jgi:hypothetical protein
VMPDVIVLLECLMSVIYCVHCLKPGEIAYKPRGQLQKLWAIIRTEHLRQEIRLLLKCGGL